MKFQGSRVMSELHSRDRVRFREREAARLVRAVREAGGGRITIDPRTGNYLVEVSSGAKDDNAADEWDEALAK